MATAITISASRDLEKSEPALDHALKRFQDRLNALPSNEMVAVVEAVARAITPVEAQPPSVIRALTGDRRFSAEERTEAEVDMLRRSFERRRALLDGALSTNQVAKLLGVSRQTPHDRLETGSLLAVMDRGAYRFPRWQFDPNGEDGVVQGLPAVLRALDASPLAKAAWLTRANPMLDGNPPLACLADGHVKRVIALARAVGLP